MKLKLKTTELQEMVGKASKCSSNNKLIPITSLMNICVDENKMFRIGTTDATNYFYALKPEVVDCEPFEVSVMSEVFTKLIQKTTSEETTLVLEDSKLKVVGNGTYTMELPVDENDNVIKFPNKLQYETSGVSNIQLNAIKHIINFNKSSLATDLTVPSLTAYYCGDKVVTSDKYKICASDVKLFDEPRLISHQLMDILDVFTGEKIEFSCNNDISVFKTEREIVVAKNTEGIEGFPIAAIMGLVNKEFASDCVVSKNDVLNLIDRLSLFVNPYDKKAIHLTFTKDGIVFSSKKSSGSELVPYLESNNFAEYTCCINIEFLRTQIATHIGENIHLFYGSDISIKLEENDVTEIIALMEDNNE